MTDAEASALADTIRNACAGKTDAFVLMAEFQDADGKWVTLRVTQGSWGQVVGLTEIAKEDALRDRTAAIKSGL